MLGTGSDFLLLAFDFGSFFGFFPFSSSTTSLGGSPRGSNPSAAASRPWLGKANGWARAAANSGERAAMGKQI